MAPIIGVKFFPLHSSFINTFDALLVFAIGFICRPLGGIFFGYLGDTRGRAKTLRLSILMITFSTVLTGIMPSYDDIGIFASVLFIALRLIQGLSLGGEYSGVMIYLAESAPLKKRGFITSFAATGANLGFLLAMLSLIALHSYFSEAQINAWAWRLPFILIGIPGALIMYYRLKLKETRIYLQLQKHQKVQSIPFLIALKFAPHQLFKILGLTCMSSTFYYFFFGFMPTYLEHYVGFSLKTALTIQSCLLVAMLFLVPLAGRIGDYFTRKKLLILNACLVMLFILPCFYLLESKITWLITLTLSIAAILSSIDQGNSLPAVVENCPENVRYSGISFSYNMGMALFGGTTPLIIVLLINQFNVIAPAYYLLIMAIISFTAATTLVGGNKSLGPI